MDYSPLTPDQIPVYLAAKGLLADPARATVSERARAAHAGQRTSGARVDENVSFGVGGHAGRLAEI